MYDGESAGSKIVSTLVVAAARMLQHVEWSEARGKQDPTQRTINAVINQTQFQLRPGR
jgi:hypothetical protein